MLKRVVVAVTAACLASTAFAADPNRLMHLHSDYDRFKQQTTVVSAPLFAVGWTKFGVPAHFLASLSVLNDDRKIPDTMALMSYNYADGWQYLNCNEFDWLVDGKPFELPTPIKQNKSMSGPSVSETFHWAIDRKVLDRLVNAKSIEWKICNDEYKLPDANIAELHKYRDVIDAAKASLDAGKRPAPL